MSLWKPKRELVRLAAPPLISRRSFLAGPLCVWAAPASAFWQSTGMPGQNQSIAAAGSWLSIYNPTITSDAANIQNATLVIFIPSPSAGSGQTQGRITYKFGATEGTVTAAIVAMYAGRGTGTIDFANAPTQVLFGGAGTINGTAGGTGLSDTFTLPETYSSGSPFCVSWGTHASSATIMATDANAGTNLFFVAGNNADAPTQNKTEGAYTSAGTAALFVDLIEVM